MNFTHPYWTPPYETRLLKTLAPIANNYGFQFNLPYPDPVTAGFYYGENPPLGRREYVYDSRPEYFTVGGNIMPTVNGKPRFDPHSPDMTFSREKHTVRI